MSPSIQIPPEIDALGEHFRRIWILLPPLPTREDLCKVATIYKPSHLANLDCQGRGPAGRMRFNNRVVYPKDEAVKWLAAQVKPIEVEKKEGLKQGRHPQNH